MIWKTVSEKYLEYLFLNASQASKCIVFAGIQTLFQGILVGIWLFYCSPLALFNSLLLSYLHSYVPSARQPCHTNPKQAALLHGWWQNHHMVYRTSAVITVMSEDRIHSAELENRWEDLHNGSEDQKPTNKPEPPKRTTTTKPLNLLMIHMYVCPFSECFYDTCDGWQMHLSANLPPNTFIWKVSDTQQHTVFFCSWQIALKITARNFANMLLLPLFKPFLL